MGEKEVLVLVHGFVQNQKIFDKQVEHFKDTYNIVAIDLRGHGMNSRKDGPYGNEEYTDDIQEYFENNGLRDVIYWGTHTGTGVGINLYFRNSTYIKKMILEGVVIPGTQTPEIARNISRVRKVYVENGLPQAHKDWIEESDWYQYMNQHPKETRKEEQCAIIKEFEGKPWKCDLPAKKPRDMTEELKNIQCDCLIYNGEHDAQEFTDMASIFHVHTNCMKKIIPNSGGFPLWENYSFVNLLVEFWLGKRKDQPSA